MIEAEARWMITREGLEALEMDAEDGMWRRQINETLAQIERRLEQIEARVARLDTHSAQLAQETLDVLDRVDRLQNDVRRTVEEHEWREHRR